MTARALGILPSRYSGQIARVRRHWKKLALSFAVAAAAGCLLFALLSREPEPSYQGRRLSEWLLNPPSLHAESAALLHMGSNALPCLVNWACAPPPKWRKSIADFCLNHPKTVPNFVTTWAAKPLLLCNATSDAFWMLDTNAYPALPQLSFMMIKTNNEASAQGAYRSIIAALRGSFFTDSGDRREPKLNRMVLEHAFKHPDPVVRQAATNGLWFTVRHDRFSPRS
jgi:hypothetical protein